MDAGRAASQEVGALLGRIGDAELEHGLRVVLARRSSSAITPGGMVAPHIPVMVVICLKLVIGMMPATIGTSMPTARASRTKSKYSSLSKKSCVTRKRAPAATFSLRKRRSLARSAASGWTSGKHAAPMQ